jgi:hypothetical protein
VGHRRDRALPDPVACAILRGLGHLRLDLGGIIGAILGAVIVLGVVTWIVRRTAKQQRARQRRLAVPVSHSR